MMDIHSSVVLITGISGFTGGHLARALKDKGAVVWGLSSEAVRPENPNILKADLRDYDGLLKILKTVRPDYIVHLAGIAFAAHDNAIPYYDVNVLGTQNLLDACVNAELSLQKVIIASSAAVYGDPQTDITAESQSFNPQGHYGCSKLSMEFIVQGYQDKLPLLITRPFNYTGVGQAAHFLIPKIVKHFKNREATIELGNTNIVREFSDVRDVAQVYTALLSQPKNGIVNLCSGIDCSFEKLIQTLKAITGHDIQVQVNEKFIRPSDITRLVGNPTKLHSWIGNKYNNTHKDTLSWMLQNT